jgi:hypothetical protein
MATQWEVRTARSAHDCERCGQCITRGQPYYARNGWKGHSFFCLACGVKLSEPAPPKANPARPIHRKRKAHDPLLGPGHVVHGLGRMGA